MLDVHAVAKQQQSHAQTLSTCGGRVWAWDTTAVLIESYNCWILSKELDRNFVTYWSKGLAKYMNAWVDLR